jgi:hypothetical protein
LTPCIDFAVLLQGRNVCEGETIDNGDAGYEEWGSGWASGGEAFGTDRFYWTKLERFDVPGVGLVRAEQKIISIGFFCSFGGYSFRAVSEAFNYIYFDQNNNMQAGGEKRNVYDDVSLEVSPSPNDATICCPSEPELTLTSSIDNSEYLASIGLNSPIPEPLGPDVDFDNFTCSNPLP